MVSNSVRIRLHNCLPFSFNVAVKDYQQERKKKLIDKWCGGLRAHSLFDPPHHLHTAVSIAWLLDFRSSIVKPEQSSSFGKITFSNAYSFVRFLFKMYVFDSWQMLRHFGSHVLD